MRHKQQVFAVLRIDEFSDFGTPMENKVTVQQIVSDRKVAELEVERLSRLNGDAGCRYCWQATRYIEAGETSASECPVD